jgi:tRNA pseudouridine38-40 synthase
MTRYKIIIEYFGGDLVGWQKQNNGQSVQGFIESAIYQFTHEVVVVYAAGRTDSGVHARGQVAHFDLVKQVDIHTIIRATNHFLRPNHISILDCMIVSDDFHARFSAKKRHYQYVILHRKAPPAIDSGRVWHVSCDLDIIAMKRAAEFLLGMHDFSSFRASECQANSAIKTLEKLDIVQSGHYIYFNLSAISFLHHMVRNIVGTLYYVGIGRINASDMPHIINARDRSKAGITAPAEGLYFMKVDY